MAKHLKTTLLLAAGSTLLVNLLSVYRPLWQPFERRIYDLKYRIVLSDTKQEDIVIVDIDTTTLRKLGRYQNWPRVYFAEAIDHLKNARAIGIDILFAEPDTLPQIARSYYQKPNFDSVLAGSLKNNGKAVLVSVVEQNSIFSDICLTGLGEIIADEDGIVRKGYYTITVQPGNDPIKEVPTFASMIVRQTGFTPPPGRFLIYYHGGNAFRQISFSDVFLKRVPPEFFNDKIVMIGGSAPGLFDYHSVPFARSFPGILIQANLVNNILKGLKIKEIPYIFVIVLTFILTLVITFLTTSRRVYGYAIPFAAILLLTAVLSVVLFSQKIELGITRPYYTFILAVIGALIYRYQFEEKEKKKIKSIFARYYSRELVDKVIAKPPKLGGEKVACTILFADIRNFTTYAEKSPPEAVGDKLNKFLTEMVLIVFKYQGRIDKFIGDCVMAVFGSPVELKNSALNACLAAKEMVKKATQLGFNIGVGINTGEVISGNFGSPMRMEYTVIGDAVNLAARLEGVTKEYPVDIIVSETTHEMAIKNPMLELRFKDLGKTKVKGKEEEIIIYALE